MINTSVQIHVSLVTSKTKVVPIKKITIHRLELCGTRLLAELLYHVQGVLQISLDRTYASTDSTIVLNWISENPHRFKPYVGNRVEYIIDQIPPERWHDTNGTSNPADCS